jgi:hypothetical protein
MPRADLLALTPDDLTALTNRGTVKRAQREVEEAECTCELTEADDGAVSAKWSDGVTCRLPAGVVLRDAHCSCAAPGLCRHLVRTVLAYQKQAPAPDAGKTSPTSGPWDPGAFGDEDLARSFRPAVLARLRGQFQQGLLVELVRSSKPSARFHLQGCLLRFLVPGDLRYTHCDCAEAAPCGHVPLAVWAFRRLAPEQTAGILATGEKSPSAPLDLLDGLETAALGLTEYGVSGAASAWVDGLARLESACREQDLVWPAEILAELAEQRERYAGHDARFSADRVADLVGELLARCDAIRRDSGALPQMLIRGASAERATDLGAARFVGLGCGVRVARRRVELTAFLQDSDSGSVVAVRRDFADTGDDPEQARPFAELAHATAVKRSSFAALGAGQLLIRGGKRTAGFHLLPGRADASVQPQAFAWESLRAPALVEDFAELDGRLAALPPASLRPRRVAEDFHICPVATVEGCHFDSAAQTVEAALLDGGGRRLLLRHPYTSRGRDGCEALLAALSAAGVGLRFVSGVVRRSAAGLVIHPVCLVFQDGASRTAVQPWIDRRPAAAGEDHLPARATAAAEPVGEYLGRLQEELGELLLLGLQRGDGAVARRWRELQRRGESLGMARLAGCVAPLAEALQRRSHTVRWDWEAAGRVLLALAVVVRMAQDLASA